MEERLPQRHLELGRFFFATLDKQAAVLGRAELPWHRFSFLEPTQLTVGLPEVSCLQIVEDCLFFIQICAKPI